MNEINAQEVIQPLIDEQLGFLPKFLRKTLNLLISWIVFPEKVNNLHRSAADKNGIEFINALFSTLNFTYNYSKEDYNNIPRSGRLIVVSNHPLGGLDGLALLSLIHSVRSDVKIFANNILSNIRNLDELFIPISKFAQKADKNMIRMIDECMANEQAIILFPAGAVSRARRFRIIDGIWSASPVKFANKYNAPVLPVYINCKNSYFYYFISKVSSELAAMMLPREILKKRFKTLNFKIGSTIPSKIFDRNKKHFSEYAHQLREHVINIGLGKFSMFV